jgi:hypothetical protein
VETVAFQEEIFLLLQVLVARSTYRVGTWKAEIHSRHQIKINSRTMIKLCSTNQTVVIPMMHTHFAAVEVHKLLLVRPLRLVVDMVCLVPII